MIAFSTVPGIGPARLKLLVDYFGSVQKAWEAKEAELIKVGLPKDPLAELLKQKNKLNVNQYIENIKKRGIKIVTINSPIYPEGLKNIPDPPNVLFIKEKTDCFATLAMTKRVIGVVGTRKITSYGREVTQMLTTGLVSAGFTIVSGMALGVDGVAHQTTIDNKGTTIAVLGAGVDIIYPPSHRDLYNSILSSGGAIVSEVAPEKFVGRGIFPARNRIISGLSEAILITEGAIDSGSLITAKCALEQGREVFAVPGPINSAMAEGTNYLLKQGAKLVTDVRDILETLGYSSNLTNLSNRSNKQVVGDTEEEQKIIDLLRNEEMEFDDLVRQTKISASFLGAILGTMEVKGKIRNSGQVYRLS